jgi:hypothetical protein
MACVLTITEVILACGDYRSPPMGVHLRMRPPMTRPGIQHSSIRAADNPTPHAVQVASAPPHRLLGPDRCTAKLRGLNWSNDEDSTDQYREPLSLPAFIAIPHVAFCSPDESVATITARWDEWVDRRATVITNRDHAEDSPGVRFDLLHTTIRIVPAPCPVVVIAEPRVLRGQSVGTNLMFDPFLPWPPTTYLGARLTAEPDVIWDLPRDLTVDDVAPQDT